MKYCTAADLVETLYRGLADNSVGKIIDTLLRNDLIIIDEVGFAPLDDTGTQLLFRLVAAAYERRSLAIASHWPFDQWGRFLPEHTTAVSILDRLLHHATVVVTTGESYRMRDARNHRGGTPPPHPENSARGGDFYLATSGDIKLAIDTTGTRRKADTTNHRHPTDCRHNQPPAPDRLQTQPTTGTRQNEHTANHRHPTECRHSQPPAPGGMQTQPTTGTRPGAEHRRPPAPAEPGLQADPAPAVPAPAVSRPVGPAKPEDLAVPAAS